MTDTRPILIVGLPRSGTTWFGEVLASAHKTRYIFEPDNEGLSPIAWLCKRELHRYPYLTSKDIEVDYYKMWDTILAGNLWAWHINAALGYFMRRGIPHQKNELEAYIGDKSGYAYVDTSMHWVGPASKTKPYRVETHPLTAFLARRLLAAGKGLQPTRRLIIKSVHAPLSLEWLISHFVVDLIVVLRNPYSLYASYKRMRLPDGFRNLLFQPTLQRDQFDYLPERARTLTTGLEEPAAFQIMLMYKIIEKQLAKHPDWSLISHDRLCTRPHEAYNHIFSSLGLTWSEATNDRIDTLNKPGKDFAPSRVSEQQPFKWKSELTETDRKAIQYWIDRFDLNNFFREYINLE